jgi:hypothetical protein
MARPAPPPPSYGGAPSYPPQVEAMLTRRIVFGLNAIGLLGIWAGLLIRVGANDVNGRGIGHFLVISGGILAALVSLAGGLGSKRTTDLQNVGLLVWAGLLLGFTAAVFTWIGT